MKLDPGVSLLNFRLAEKIGEGGMGEVWKATDTTLGRDIAIKFLPASLASDPERLARFEREAKVLASLNNPGIAAIYGLHEHQGVRFLAMELVPGEDLAQRLERGTLPFSDAIDIARQIAEAVEVAHDQGIVHRDLKPANIKITPEGKVKVLDFGLAKALDPMASGGQSGVDSRMSPTITSLGTVAGVILGTAAYMSPEQAKGRPVDRRTDIWAFGCIVYEMLAGRRPFDGEGISEVLAAVIMAPIAFDALPESVPARVRNLVRRCLERDPRKRLRDIGEARIVLEGGEIEVDRGQVPVPVPSRAPRIAWAAALVVVALSAVAIVAALRKPPTERPVTRFQVAADPRLASMTWPRISPDGRTLAFLGRDANGKTAIWVRPLDAFAPYPLQDTEGAARFFWSPDSKYVAYFIARSQLKKSPVAGGPAQLICEASGGADGAWSVSGDILFDGRATDAIRRVAAAGGIAAQATQPDAAKGEAGHAWPYFLPDGQHFVFLAMSKRAGEKSMIHVGTLGKPGSKPITPTDSRAEYANGYLLYVLQGTLVARRFDPDKLEASGEPIPLVEHVSIDINATASFSASNEGVLAFTQGDAGTASELVWLDRTGHEVGKIGEPASYADFAISPDGTRLAYGLADRAGAQDIWVRDLKRDVASRLTFDPTNEIWPMWSPDGRRIAYASDRGGHFAIMVRDANGTGTEQPVYSSDDSDVGSNDWSRDGRRMLVSILPASRRWDIKSISMDGTATVSDYLVTDASEIGPSFSPDGRFVAYSSNESGTGEIYVQTFPPGGGKWQISNGGGQQARWRADGRELFFMTPTDVVRAVPVSTAGTFEPGMPVDLFKRPIERGANMRNRFFPSADGQRFLVNAARQTSQAAPLSVIINWPAALAK